MAKVKFLAERLGFLHSNVKFLYHFLISHDPKSWATLDETCVPSLLYQISSFIYLWDIGPVLNHYKVPKYFDQDGLKNFSCTLFASSDDPTIR